MILCWCFKTILVFVSIAHPYAVLGGLLLISPLPYGFFPIGVFYAGRRGVLLGSVGFSHLLH